MAEEQPAPTKPAKAEKPSILDRIKSADDMASLDKAKILLYGPSGAGKTSFGAGMPRPLIGLTEKQARDEGLDVRVVTYGTGDVRQAPATADPGETSPDQ